MLLTPLKVQLNDGLVTQLPFTVAPVVRLVATALYEATAPPDAGAVKVIVPVLPTDEIPGAPGGNNEVPTVTSKRFVALSGKVALSCTETRIDSAALVPLGGFNTSVAVEVRGVEAPVVPPAVNVAQDGSVLVDQVRFWPASESEPV